MLKPKKILSDGKKSAINNLKQRYLYKVGYTLLVLPLFLLLASCYPPAQTVSSPASDSIAKAPSTQVYFYPKTNKTQEQQDRDRYECYNWSVEQTNFDPGSPSIPPQHRVIVRPIPPPGTSTAVGALTGAAVGALAAGPRHAGGGLLIGAAIGAMFGAVSDASRQEQAQNLEEAYNKQDQVRDAQMERKASDFRRAMSACLESRGYSAQ
jgi:Glycine zipper